MIDEERYTVRLEKAGFNKKQAETLMNCQYEMMKENFATKLDISELKSELISKIDSNKDEIRNTKSELISKIDSNRDEIRNTKSELTSKIDSNGHGIQNTNQRIENTKNEMIIKLGAMMISGVIITIGSMGLMLRLF